jgi:hypothetical protein
MPNDDELLDIIRALEDAGHWGSPSSSSSQDSPLEDDEPEDDLIFNEQLKEIKALGDADHKAFPQDESEPEDDTVFNEQLKELRALGDADYHGASPQSPPSRDEPEDDLIFNEQLKEIRALGDPDYWSSPSSSQDDPEDEPASGAPPKEFEDFDESNDWPHLAPSTFDDRQLVREFWYLPTGCFNSC